MLSFYVKQLQKQTQVSNQGICTFLKSYLMCFKTFLIKLLKATQPLFQLKLLLLQHAKNVATTRKEMSTYPGGTTPTMADSISLMWWHILSLTAA